MKLLKMSSNAIFPQVISLAPNKAKKNWNLLLIHIWQYISRDYCVLIIVS